MKTYLCVVSPRFPENYHIGVRAGKWGVEERYSGRIDSVQSGDELVFIASNSIQSVHKIESEPFVENNPLWPAKDGDIFPYRIRISEPIFKGKIPKEVFTQRISFMKDKERWGGTIQGRNGIFNTHLSSEDIQWIKSELNESFTENLIAAEPPSSVAHPKPTREGGTKALFRFFEKDVLLALTRLLPALGLRRFNGKDFPGEYDLGYGGNVVLCVDLQTEDFVVVDFNRGEAPNDTLIRLLHYMSWVRQHLAEKKDVRGVILAESTHDTLNEIVHEVPNVAIRCYRLGIELLESA